jgi:SEL1 protein
VGDFPDRKKCYPKQDRTVKITKFDLLDRYTSFTPDYSPKQINRRDLGRINPPPLRVEVNHESTMYTLDASASFAIVQPPGVYIYDIASVADGVVSISSDDTLRLIDPTSLHLQPLYTVPEVNHEITCLKVLEENTSIICTAGRDGKVNILDLRQRLKVGEVHTSKTYISLLRTRHPPLAGLQSHCHCPPAFQLLSLSTARNARD